MKSTKRSAAKKSIRKALVYRKGSTIEKIFNELKDGKPKPTALFVKRYRDVDARSRLTCLAARGRRNGGWKLIRKGDNVQLSVNWKRVKPALAEAAA